MINGISYVIHEQVSTCEHLRKRFPAIFSLSKCMLFTTKRAIPTLNFQVRFFKIQIKNFFTESVDRKNISLGPSHLGGTSASATS